MSRTKISATTILILDDQYEKCEWRQWTKMVIFAELHLYISANQTTNCLWQQ